MPKHKKICFMSFRLMTLLFKTNAALLRVSLNQKILPQVGQQSKHTMITSNVTHLLIWIGPDKKKSHSDFNEYTRQSCVCTAMPKKIKLLIGGDPLLKTDLCLIKREKKSAKGKTNIDGSYCFD